VTFDVEIGGRRRQIELERAGPGWRATVDGRVLEIDAVQIGSAWSLLIGRPDGPYTSDVGSRFSRTSYEAAIHERGSGELIVHIGGHAIAVGVTDPRAYRRRRPGHESAGQSGVRHILAPMPGRIVRVLVEVGERVTARQGLVVVEAMKMENELRAPRDATVRDVRATEGATVEAGTILVVLE
jgi:biotin carboxyl carrier protein